MSADNQPEIVRLHTAPQKEFRTGIWFDSRGDVVEDVDERLKEEPLAALYLVARDGNRPYLAEKDKMRKELKLDNPKMAKKIREIGYLTATCHAMAAAILLDWKNVFSHEDNDDGSPKLLEPTETNRRKTLLENPEFKDLITGLSADFEAFDEALREKTAGKSRGGSIGGNETATTSPRSNE